jgi:acetyl-CoA synthetase (ADP-forming)
LSSQRSQFLELFFNPHSISVVGASPDENKLGNILMHNLLDNGFPGRIYPVNPAHDQVMGLPCYRSISDIPEVTDLSLILLPARLVSSSLREHAKRAIRNVIVLSAGFSEVGEEGAALQREIESISKETGIRIIGPNCLGIFDNISKLDTFFVPRNMIQRAPIGNISLASQSGSFVGHLMDILAFEGIGVARVITYGNRVDVDEVDTLHYFADDEKTKIVGLYIEGLKSGQDFVRAASYCSSKKPVLVLKTGKSESVSSAIASHTGALAGSYAAYHAAFRKASLVEVESELEFVDACKVISMLPRARADRVLIIGHAGGLGLTLADFCLKQGLRVPHITPGIIQRLKSHVLPYASLVNPVDITASGTDDQTSSVLEEAFVKGNFADIAIYVGVWGLPQSTDRIAEILKEALVKSGKPVLVASVEGKKCIEKLHLFHSAGIPAFLSLERAAKAAKLTLSLRNKVK